MKEFVHGQVSSSPKVSIIIPVYNVEKYVGECIESVMAQDAQIPIECIVVDDCGPDNSMDVVNKVVDEYHGPIEFRIITREKNGGLSAARNSGINAARGEYLYFIDSDDTITPDAIRLLWQQVEEHPGIDMVVGAAKCFPTPDMDAYLNLKRFDHPKFSCNEKLNSRFFLKIPEIVWNKLFRLRFLLDNNLNFKERIILEDFHLHLRLSYHIQSIAFVDIVTYNYRMRKGSIIKEANYVLRQKQVCEIFVDVVNQGYSHPELLKLMTCRFTDYYCNIGSYDAWFSLKEPFAKCLRLLCADLSFIKSLPFRYLRLPRPWMRVAILKILTDICFR